MKRYTGILVAALVALFAACQADPFYTVGPADRGSIVDDTVIENLHNRPPLWAGASQTDDEE